jgi:hypothetical protein
MMNFQPRNEAELTAASLVKKQQNRKKIVDKIEALRINPLIILMIPLLLASLQFVAKNYGLDVDLVSYGSLTFILLLIIWTNEKIELIYKLILSNLESES